MTVLISGGSRGIGKAIAKAFAAQGAHVILLATNESNLVNAKDELISSHPSAKIETIVADLSSKKACQSVVNTLVSLEVIDIIINNAGTFVPGSILDEKEGTLEHLIETNLYSAYYLTRGLIHKLKKSAKGHIFNMCSVASIMPYDNGGSYSISKYALLGFSKCLREELKSDKIKVSSIMPGATYTDSWKESGIPEDRFMKAEDLADLIVQTYALSKNTLVEELIIRPILGDI